MFQNYQKLYLTPSQKDYKRLNYDIDYTVQISEEKMENT